MKKLVLICLMAFIVASAKADVTVWDGAVSYEGTMLSGLNLSTGQTESDNYIFVWDEQQNVTLTQDLAVDITEPGEYNRDKSPTPSTVSAGTTVSSYILHFDEDTGGRTLSGSITFDTPVLGIIMATNPPDSLVASDGIVGIPTTTYGPIGPSPHNVRGLETFSTAHTRQDPFTLSEDELTVSFVLYTSGGIDEMRIITEAYTNQPPVAVCQEDVVAVGEMSNINGGSYDPDGDPITLEQSPPGSFNEAGIYEVTLMVADDRGALDSCVAMVVVYDPSDGFVTGGGWIYSKPGAYRPDTSLEGKANFGFVSRYKKGATVPTGQTEFVFKAGDLNFHSSSYDWLVVNQGGNNAQFKGSGTINGEGDYKFMLWAEDGDPDTFRIKIWYENGSEVVVYDNDFDQAIDGGSIIVHKGKN
jgi:hypothetical protein